ncbi:hypothetical protein GCM10022247_12460 [Allokutzneria multivorans]|uniref:Uncharacterized protein n=1 Tax=Allokutzneria multivorans TaxID=1142134 RepID=A0ABP7R9Q6_9PSEU
MSLLVSLVPAFVLLLVFVWEAVRSSEKLHFARARRQARRATREIRARRRTSAFVHCDRVVSRGRELAIRPMTVLARTAPSEFG